MKGLEFFEVTLVHVCGYFSIQGVALSLLTSVLFLTRRAQFLTDLDIYNLKTKKRGIFIIEINRSIHFVWSSPTLAAKTATLSINHFVSVDIIGRIIRNIEKFLIYDRIHTLLFPVEIFLYIHSFMSDFSQQKRVCLYLCLQLITIFNSKRFVNSVTKWVNSFSCPPLKIMA